MKTLSNYIKDNKSSFISLKDNKSSFISLSEKLLINKNFVNAGDPDDDVIDDIIDRNLWENKDEKLSNTMKCGSPISMCNTAWEIFCNEANIYGIAPYRNVIDDIRNKIKSMYNSDSKYPILKFSMTKHVNDMFDDFEKANVHTKVLIKETPKYDINVEWISTEKYDMLFFGKLAKRYYIFLHRKK